MFQIEMNLEKIITILFLIIISYSILFSLDIYKFISRFRGLLNFFYGIILGCVIFTFLLAIIFTIDYFKSEREPSEYGVMSLIFLCLLIYPICFTIGLFLYKIFYDRLTYNKNHLIYSKLIYYVEFSTLNIFLLGIAYLYLTIEEKFFIILIFPIFLSITGFFGFVLGLIAYKLKRLK
jgi:hypothetical protein